MLSFSELIDFIPRVVTLEVLRADLIDRKIAGLKGRIVKTTGDGCCRVSKRRRGGGLCSGDSARHRPTPASVPHSEDLDIASTPPIRDNVITGDGELTQDLAIPPADRKKIKR